MRAARRVQTEYQTDYIPESDAPIMSATALYMQLKCEFSGNIQLDQAIRIITHCVEFGFDDEQLSERAYECFTYSCNFEDACTRVAKIEDTEQAKRKARMVRDIRSYLADCLK